jgi:cytochrome b pre-mRNA-processing protein 3
MLLNALRRRGDRRRAALAAYATIVERARSPHFYLERQVPDTLDGRFELISLHLFLVLHRLRGEPSAQAFGQVLFDTMFADMDRGLREMGTSDLGVGKQVKLMAKGFYGRVAAYQDGLAGGALLADGLRRNLFGTVTDPSEDAVEWFCNYLQRQSTALAQVDATVILAGNVPFAPLATDAEASLERA